MGRYLACRGRGEPVAPIIGQPDRSPHRDEREKIVAIIPRVDGERCYKNLKDASPGPWDVIVIGTGIGGMSAAAALARGGRRVLLLERHYLPGGFTHAYSRKGFEWDVGVHAIGEMGPGELPGRILAWLTGGAVKMVSLGNPFDRFRFDDGEEFALPDSRKAYEAALRARFPDQAERIGNYLRVVDRVCLYSKAFFLLKSLPRSVAQLANGLIHRLSRDWWATTTAEVFDELGISGRLRTILSLHWGYYGSPPATSSFPVHALTHSHFWNGAYYPAHGATALAEGLISTIQSAGGEVLCRAEVRGLIVEGGRAVGVTTADGTQFRAPIVISAAGAKRTVGSIVPEALRDSEWGRTILGIPDSPPYICLNLGFEGPLDPDDAAAANLWLLRGADAERPLWDPRDGSAPHILYVSFPSKKNPHHQPGPKERQTGECVTFVPWELFSAWRDSRHHARPEAYRELKGRIEALVLAELRLRLPKLMEKLVFCELSTPLSTEHFTGASRGAIYGLEASPRRFTCDHLRSRTPLPGFYLTGVDMASLGVVGGMVSGVLTAASIDPRVYLRLI